MIDCHTHTSYSKHGRGSIEELVQIALERGISVLTITDHAPFHIDTDNRLLQREVGEYFNEIDRVSAMYERDITILRGLEADFIPGCEEALLRQLRDINLDFLIGSVHYVPLGESLVRVWELPQIQSARFLGGYFASLRELVLSGLFDAVGHPDAVLRAVPEDLYCKMFTPLIPLMKQKNVSYELNASGLRKTAYDPATGEERYGTWTYPSLKLIRALVDEGVGFTLGSDAHAPEELGTGLEQTIVAAATAGVNTISYYQRRKQVNLPLTALRMS